MAYYVPPSAKVGGHVPRPPYQFAPMVMTNDIFVLLRCLIVPMIWTMCLK